MNIQDQAAWWHVRTPTHALRLALATVMPARLASIPPRSALCTVSTRALTFGLSIGRNINAVIIPFLMIVGGARHEPIHRMHGMSLSTHPCQRHSVACGCDVAVARGPCSPLGRHQHRLAAISASGRER